MPCPLLHISLKPSSPASFLGTLHSHRPVQGFQSPSISLVISHTDPPQSFLAPKSSSENHYNLWPGCFLLSGYHFCWRASAGTSDTALPPSVPVPRRASSSCCPKAPHSLQRRLSGVEHGRRAPTTLSPQFPLHTDTLNSTLPGLGHGWRVGSCTHWASDLTLRYFSSSCPTPIVPQIFSNSTINQR